VNKFLFGLLAVTLVSSFGFSEAKIGAPAPAFEVMDATGKTHKLADFKGKNVILEWYNKDCPYVVKHYSVGNMQKIQKETTDKGFVWLTVISSAKGKQGYLESKEALANAQAAGAAPTAILIDDLGKMGRAYGAKTTPHMYLIDDKGILRYNGAIDSNSSANSATIAKADNYILAATNSLLNGEKISKESTKPYGCSVKY
jgi:peroxiredoxin